MHRTPSAPRSSNLNKEAAETSALRRSTVIRPRIPERRSTRLIPPALVPNVDKVDEMILQDTLQVSLTEPKSQNVVDDSSIPRNDESNILSTRIEPRSNKESPEAEITKDKEVEITKDKEVEITKGTPVVDITNIVIPVNVNDEDVEITDEVYKLKRKEKGKIVEETRNSPIPTPIRSPRIHTNLVSSDTEKLQDLTDTPHTTSSSNEMILQDTLQVSLAEHKSREEQEARENVALVDEHLASEEIEKMVDGQENIIDDSSIPRNDEPNISGTRIEPRSNKESPEVKITKDKEVEITKETPVVEITNVVIPVNINDDDEEITDEVYELKRREKGKLVEETRNSPIPTPIRSPRIHTNLVSSDTEKLQDLTDTPHTTSSSSLPHKKLAKMNRLLSLFKTKPTRFKRYKSFFHELQGRYGYLFAHLRASFMPRKSFNTLADNLHDVMVETLPSMVNKHIKEQVVKQVVKQVPEQVRNQVPERGNIQAQISTQIKNAIANVILLKLMHPYMKFERNTVLQTACRTLAVRPRDQDDPHDDAHPEGENSAKRQKTSEYEAYVSGESSSGQVFQEEQAPSTSGNQEQDDDFDFWTDSYASDDDEIPRKKLSKDPEAPALSLINQDLLYLKKGNSGPEKIVLSLHKFPAIIFNDDDIEERTSRWVPDYADTGLLWSLSVFIRSTVIWERVHDFQLGIESYQQKVNLTAPTMTFPGIEDHEMFSIIFEPVHGIIYKNSKKDKRVMRHSEIHKFCDATLNRVLEGLKSYNDDVKYGYVQKYLTKEEAEYLKLFKEEIEERLKHRRQMRR
ncbi:hypothetical protein Tco_0302936 [Tanacetum coccineum]